MPSPTQEDNQGQQQQQQQDRNKMVVTRPSLTRALQGHSGGPGVGQEGAAASKNKFSAYCCSNKPPPPPLAPKGKQSQPSEVKETVDLTSRSPTPAPGLEEPAGQPAPLQEPDSKDSSEHFEVVRGKSKKPKRALVCASSDDDLEIVESPQKPTDAATAALEDDIEDTSPIQGKKAASCVAAILSSPEDNEPGPSKAGWRTGPSHLKGKPPAHPNISVDVPATTTGLATGSTSMVQGTGQRGASPLTSPSLTLPSPPSSTDPPGGGNLLGNWQSAGPRPTQRLGGLGSLGSLASNRRSSAGGGGSGSLGSFSLRTVKIQAPAERQQEAQRALASQPPPKVARKTQHADSDSDDEGSKQDEPSLLTKVEALSEKLRALLGAQQLDERFSAVSQDGLNCQVLVGREQVAEACGPDVAATLKGYQLVGINFLTVLSRSRTVGGAILADEMGLGKTAQTITFLGLLQHAALKAWRAGEASRELYVQAGGRGPGPHLIVCPASLLENWQRELKRWCPQLRVVVYYGSDKQVIRDVLATWRRRALNAEQRKAQERKGNGGSGAEANGSGAKANGSGASKDAAIYLSSDDGGGDEDDDDEGEEEEGSVEELSDDEDLFDFQLSDPTSGEAAPFDVLLTTYSIYERDSEESKLDRGFICRWHWSHLVADEAHALKNRNSIRVQRMMKIAKYCKHRILLTGTPIQNDIDELLNLLRFLMPSLFGEELYADPEEMLGAGEESKAELTERVRRVMAPFILRRLKTEVATQLVEKTHKLIEVDMAPAQAELYQSAIKSFKDEAAAAVRGDAAAVVVSLSDKRPAASGSSSQASKRRRVTRSSTNEDGVMSDKSDASGGTGIASRCRGKTSDSRQQAGSSSAIYLDTIDEEDSEAEVTTSKTRKAKGQGGSSGGPAKQTRQQQGVGVLDSSKAVAKLGGQRINNIFAHLRKIALHPLLVRHQYSEAQMLDMANIAVRRQLFAGQCTLDKVLAEMKSWSDHVLHDFASSHAPLSKFCLPASAVYCSGKMQHLRQLLADLKARGSRVLLFSQWTQVLDLLEWFMEQEAYSYVRLDGNTQVDERLSLTDRFNDPAQGVFVFLLSTRAGGQGLNLTGADTVILHDVDFNPQVDRQAEDRCHRLGQTKPVTVYRLVTSGTVDRNIYDIAQRKLQLDADIMNGVTVATAEEQEGGEGEGGGGGGGKGGRRGGKVAAGKAGGKAGASAEAKHMGAILAALLRDA